MALPVATLYVEELKATMRGRFAWLGAGVILFVVGGLATLGTQGSWLFGFAVLAYGLIPLAFIPIAAGMMAGPRANRFVESVFTAPVGRGAWFTARILVLLTLATAYYAALSPMLLVYVWYIGVPFLLRGLLLWAPGVLVASIAIGTLIGVLFIGRSVAAPIGTGMGILVACLVFFLMQEQLVYQGNGATWTGHLVLASPAVLLKNILGFTLVAGTIPSTTSWTWLCLAMVVPGALLLAAWIFLRAQGVETWEATKAQSWVIAAAIAALVAVPIMLADTNYDKPAPASNGAPAMGRLFSRGGPTMTLVRPGARIPPRCCGPILNRQDGPLATDQGAKRDLLLFLPVDAGRRVSNFHARVSGSNGLEVDSPAAALIQPAPRPEYRTYEKDSGPPTPDGNRIVRGWVVRLPVTLKPTRPWEIGNDLYPMAVMATYDVDGDTMPHRFVALAAVEAQVSSAFNQMGLAAMLLPLLCFGAAFTRWRRTR